MIGRDFDLDLLLAVVELSETRLLDLLDAGGRRIAASGELAAAGHFTFTHALVEHTLYEDLGRTRRARLHGGWRRPSRSSAEMSPDRGSASSPAIGPPRS